MNSDEICIEAWFAAPVSLVFDAWIEPDGIATMLDGERASRNFACARRVNPGPRMIDRRARAHRD
jgi:uncharacterized protein YndB with AHSA1/START domain